MKTNNKGNSLNEPAAPSAGFFRYDDRSVFNLHPQRTIHLISMMVWVRGGLPFSSHGNCVETVRDSWAVTCLPERQSTTPHP